MGLIYLENLGNLSDFWYAVHNPWVILFKREDFTVASVADDGSGNAKITLTSPDAAKIALVLAGQQVYLNTNGYEGVFAVIDTDNSTYITIATPYVATATGYLNANDALVGYYCDIEILKEDLSLLQTARFVPLFNGSLSCDISGYVRRLAAIIDTHDYDPTTVIERDIHLSTAITVNFRERFNGEAAIPGYTEVPGDPQLLYWVNAAKQIGDLYGSNMVQYVTFPLNVSNSTDWKAKFLTLFDELYFWMGYPFDIALIFSDEAISVYTGHILRDIQTFPTFSEVATGIAPDAAGVYRLNIGDDNVTYAAAIADYITFQILSDGTPQDDQLSEAKKIWVRQCAQNSIYLKWINTLGGWSYWMFEFDQQKAIAVTDAKTFQQTIEDLATADSELQYLSKRAFPKMTIGADGITAQIMKGLKGILYSPKVMWLTNPESWNDVYDPGAKWQTVLVDPGSFTLESTREGFANVEITIEFPELNIQTQ